MSATVESNHDLIITNATIGYDKRAVVKDFNLTLTVGQIGCLLGPSGCGKSTLLRGIAGLEPLMSGEIKLGKKLFSSSKFTLAPERRGVGMVFQDIALFPHFTVGENIRFGLKHWSEKDKQQRVKELLALVGLETMENRYPDSLSGGQQQRIALARAMGPKPQLLLMDEPFSGLDASLREALVAEVREILLQEKMSALLVTHDQTEAFAIADKIAIMDHGTAVQTGNPQDIYHQPTTAFTADFIGLGGFLAATVESNQELNTSLGMLPLTEPHSYQTGDKLKVLVRPDDIVLDDASEYQATLVKKQFRGSHFLYHIRLKNKEDLLCIGSTQHDHAVGETIGIKLCLDNIITFKD